MDIVKPFTSKEFKLFNFDIFHLIHDIYIYIYYIKIKKVEDN